MIIISCQQQAAGVLTRLIKMAAEDMPRADAIVVLPESLRVTDPVVNTAAEAVAVARMLPASARVLLVTSAYHMARAKKEFEQAGLEVVAYPVDFQVSEGQRLSVMDFLPQAEALRNTEPGGGR